MLGIRLEVKQSQLMTLVNQHQWILLKQFQFPWLTPTLLIRDPEVGTEAESEEAPM